MKEMNWRLDVLGWKNWLSMRNVPSVMAKFNLPFPMK
jgi:hypothetical protein